MGYSYRNGGQIKDFWPDDTDNTFYIVSNGCDNNLSNIQEKINEKWPGSSMERIHIYAERIHTQCLGYDLYDPMDYQDFLVITKE